jgi:hypothetical protein
MDESEREVVLDENDICGTNAHDSSAMKARTSHKSAFMVLVIVLL